MEDKLSAELLIYKYSKKFLANLDLSNLDIKNSSKETKFIVILDQSGSMGQSVTNQSKATLITFSDSSQVYSGDAMYFSSLNLYATGCTYMAKALEQLESIMNNLEEGVSLRILVFSDGELHDQEKTMQLSSQISEKFKGKFRINAQAIRYYTSTYGEPDTRGLSSILQLNSVNETPKLEDINYDVEVETISDRICDYFIKDGLDLCVKLKSKLFLNLYNNPWEKPINEIRLIKGKNIFWIDNDENFKPENTNLSLELMDGSDIKIKVVMGETINQDNYKSVLNDNINFFIK